MGKHGEAFLYFAARCGRAKSVQQFLHIRKVNPNKMPKILLIACENNHLQVVDLLITNPYNPADVNIECEYEMRNKGKVITRPLFMALEMNNLTLLQLLLYRSTVEVDLECVMSLFSGDCVQDVSTPINQAVVLRHPAIVQELIKVGIEMSAESFCIGLLQYGWKVEASTEHFSLAVKQGLIGLLYNMVQLNPQVLQQSWLNDCQDFGKLPQKAVNWLLNIRRQPGTLKDLCKSRILQNLGSSTSTQSRPTQLHIPTLISQLPLPTVLKMFLQFISIIEAREDIGI